MDHAPARLVVVSNRLPAALENENGEWKVKPGAGGLITALAPVLKNRGGLWIGWSGASDPEADVENLLEGYSRKAGYGLHTVPLSKSEVDGYYYGFSNEVIWPLFHDFQSRCRFDPEYWRTYLDVNFKFAEQVARHSMPDDYVWVHDYHLIHQAFFLKSMGVKRKTGFFLHIPFPCPDIFFKLPWRAKILQALLEFELVGFQTTVDRSNFVRCVQTLLPDVKIKGRGAVLSATVQDREVRLGAFPISIDFNSFAGLAAKKSVAAKCLEIKEALRHRKIILGVDRLDYTKGIPERIEAFGTTLRRYPELKGRISFIQIAVPSREDVQEYQDLRLEIEQLVGRINGEFSEPGWVPVQYQYRNLPREELVAYYRAADMALVTPLRDGMNLVAKEYCACNISRNGVLFLSEFAGAAAQLQRNAYLVNPYDLEGVARAIHRAFYWDNVERTRLMERLRDKVRRHNIYWWVDSFLQAGASMNLDNFPPEETVRFDTD